MGDTGGCHRCPPTDRSESDSPMPRLALYALVVCVLAIAAAVISFVQGSWLMGVVWVLLTGLSSNMTWYYARRGRDGKPAAS